MDPTRTVGATEWTQDAEQTNGRADRRSETSITPPSQTTSLCGGIMIKLKSDLHSQMTPRTSPLQVS